MRSGLILAAHPHYPRHLQVGGGGGGAAGDVVVVVVVLYLVIDPRPWDARPLVCPGRCAALRAAGDGDLADGSGGSWGGGDGVPVPTVLLCHVCLLVPSLCYLSRCCCCG